MKIIGFLLSFLFLFLWSINTVSASSIYNEIAQDIWADAKTLESVRGKYFKDKNAIYHLDKKIISRDVEAFEVFRNQKQAKDSKNVFYEWEPLENADPTAFILSDGSDDVWYDKENYYLWHNKVWTKKNVTKVLSDRCFLVDDILIECYDFILYEELKKLYSAKINGELIKLNDFLYKDDLYVYNFTWIQIEISWEKNIILSKNPDDFQILNDAYSKDKDKVFYSMLNIISNEVEWADAPSFKVLKDANEKWYTYASDKNATYYNGRVENDISVANPRSNNPVTESDIDDLMNKKKQESSRFLQKISILSIIYSFAFSFTAFFISYYLILKNRKITLSFWKKTVTVFIALVLLNIIIYILSIFSLNTDGLIYSILFSILWAGIIMGITKFVFKKDLDLVTNSLLLWIAAILLTIIIWFIISLVLWGIIIGSTIK